MSITFSINRVELLGRLAADPEVRQTQSGQAVCKLRIVTDRRVKKGDEYQDESEFHSVVLWGKDAEAAGNQLHKGSRFHVASGRLQTRSWEKDGQKHYTTEIVAELVTFPDGWKKDGNGSKTSQPSAHERSKADGYQQQSEEEIPF